MHAPILHFDCPFKRVLVSLMFRDCPREDLPAWIEDARTIGALTDGDAAVCLKVRELMGEMA